MSTIHFKQVTTATAEQYIAGLMTGMGAGAIYRASLGVVIATSRADDPEAEHRQ